MSRCVDEDRIDAYVKNELPAEEAARFEEHYFNCPDCYRETAERSALLEALRAGGESVFEGRSLPRRRWRWAYAVAAAAALAAGILLMSRSGPKPLPFEFTGDETVRGPGLAIIGPKGALAAPPDRFEWHPVPSAAEYEVTLASGPEIIWKGATDKTALVIPADIRAGLREGIPYLWRVRAYAPEGRMLAASDRTTFTIGR
jgi:hypothetical protein